MFAKSLSLLVLYLAAGSAMSAAPSYSSRGETQGMRGIARPSRIRSTQIAQEASRYRSCTQGITGQA
jgi:hypothetical protein